MVAEGLAGTGAELDFLPEESDPALPKEVSLELTDSGDGVFELTLKPCKSSLCCGTISLKLNGEHEGESDMVPSDKIDDIEA